jgi:hypothetical protein
MITASRPRTYFPTRWSDAHPGAQTSLSRLSRIPPSQRRRIADLTGCPHPDAASLVDHLSGPDVALRLLDTLSPEGLALTRLLVEAVDLLPVSIAEAEAKRRLGAASEGALAELEKLGLVLRTTWAGGAELLGLVPPLTRSMRPYLWLLGDVRPAAALPCTEAPTRASVGLKTLRHLSLAVAAVAAEAPRLARDGTVHGGDATRIGKERLAGLLEEPADLGGLVDRLLVLGVLTGADGGRTRVRWRRAASIFDLPASARLPVLLSTDRGASAISSPKAPGLASAGHVRRLVSVGLLEMPAGWWARREALEDAVRLRILAADALSPYADLNRAAERARTHVRMAVGAVQSCLERHETSDETWFRLPTGEDGDPDVGWLVQPDHEIIVPPEVLAGDVIRLASVADLVRADVVSHFQIGPGSVARAMACGLDADGILERLALRADRGLPEGLETQVRDWARQNAPDLYGAPLDESAESEAAVPIHRRPKPLPLPAPPSRAWAPGIAEFRDAAGARLMDSGLGAALPGDEDGDAGAA